MYDSLKRLDLLNALMLFAMTLVMTAVSIWVASNSDQLRVARESLRTPVPTATQQSKVVKIFEDALIRVDSKYPVVVTRIKPSNYKITINADTIEFIPINLTSKNEALKITGKHNIDEALFRSFNGVVYSGFSGTSSGEQIYFVQKGTTLFKVVCSGISEFGLDKILSSVTYKVPGEFASLNFFDTGREESLLSDSSVDMKTENFEGFSFSGGRLKTNMFAMDVPGSWQIYNTAECIVLFDQNRQSEQIAIFTIKSINFTKKQYEHFLDRVYGGHEPLSNLRLGGLEYFFSDVDGGSSRFQTFLHPINQFFGLMIQSRSIEGRLSNEQRSMLSSITLR